jgi:hypothetical protein
MNTQALPSLRSGLDCQKKPNVSLLCVIAGPKAGSPAKSLNYAKECQDEPENSQCFYRFLLRFARNVALSFEWGWSFAERMTYAKSSPWNPFK